MAQLPYLPLTATERVTWLNVFSSKLSKYAASFGLSSDELESTVADAAAYQYAVTLQQSVEEFSKQCTSFRDQLSNQKDDTTVHDFPVFQLPATAPPKVAPGVFVRVRALVKKIKTLRVCTLDIQKDLGILGTDVVISFEGKKPVLKYVPTGGKKLFKYKKNKAKGLLIMSRRGTETEFSFLDKVTKNSFVDNRPNLVPGQPELRQYKAIYLYNDEPVGNESDILEVVM